MKKKKAEICWIGHFSYIGRVSSITYNTRSVLFRTKREAIAAGWEKPIRVAVLIERVKQ